MSSVGVNLAITCMSLTQFMKRVRIAEIPSVTDTQQSCI